MTTHQKKELLQLIEATGNQFTLLAIGKTLNILTVIPLDDNEREVYNAYIDKSMKVSYDEFQRYAESKREDLAWEAEQEMKGEGAESENELQ